MPPQGAAEAPARTRSGHKRCRHCGEEKPVGVFYADRSRSDGLNDKCAPCARAYNRRYRQRRNKAPMGPDFIPDPETGCWVWQKYLNEDGYGRLMWQGKPWKAHRWFYVQIVGPIPEDLGIDHLCCNKACVNPAHMEPVTAAENARRRWERERAVAS